jgi:dynein heavy chain 1, cytosolic
VVTTRPQLPNEKVVTVAVIKRQGELPLEAARSIQSQLRVVNLGDGSPFETLHAVIRHSLSPYFKSFVSQLRGADDGKGNLSSGKSDQQGLGINAVSQKMAELELSLYNVKQSVQIPHVVLSFHPTVQTASSQVRYLFCRCLKREGSNPLRKW